MRSVSTGGRRLTHAALAAAAHVIEPSTQITRKELAAAARDAMKGLKLRPSLRLVLAELVGCFGGELIEDRMMVWPSNDYLVQRTGLSERAVRYGIRGLVELELIAPRDSANGKRFSIKGAGGKILKAYGFDLTPVWARRKEWIDLIEEQKRAGELVRRRFDDITIYRRAVEEAILAIEETYPHIDRGELEADLAELRTKTPRRSPHADPAFLDHLLGRWRELHDRAERLFLKAGYGGKSCHLIENNNDPIIPPNCHGHPEDAERGEIPSPPTDALSLKLILEACPALSEYWRPIFDERQLIEAGSSLRGSIGAHPTAWTEAVDRLGETRAAAAVLLTLQLHHDDVTSRQNRIKNPGGYFRALVRMIADGRVNLEVELMTLRRKHMRRE